jgi:hypothetical protein
MSTMVMPSANHKPFHSESDPFGIYKAYSKHDLKTVDNNNNPVRNVT